MRRAIALAATAAALLSTHTALPCGGGFGFGLNLSADQKIVVRHDQGTETYFFSPHFCGNAARFGLILPVPAALTASPTLGDTATVGELEDITKPTVVNRTLCQQDRSNGGAGGAGSYKGDAGGIAVIDKGTVGIFDWTLIKADTTQAFTDWLTANQYPYDASALRAFTYYVTDGWYFVAFKVTADAQDPPAGRQLCGDFGPIQLSFPATTAVIPSRIAAASSSPTYSNPFGWRVFAIAARQLELPTTGVSQTPRFSGALSAADLAAHPAVAKLAAAGERLTEVDGYFYPSQLVTDLQLVPTATDTDYRRTEYHDTYIDCDAGRDATTPTTDASPVVAPASAVPIEEDSGCSTGPRPSRGSLWAMGAALLALALHRARRR